MHRMKTKRASLPLLLIFLLCQLMTRSQCTGSFQFDGVSQVSLPNNNQYYASTGFTWECWFKLSSLNQQDSSFQPRQVIVIAEDGALCEDILLTFGWYVGVKANYIGFVVDGPGGCGGRDNNPCKYRPAGGFIVNSWYHVAGVRNYATNKEYLYLNGQPMDSTTNTRAPMTRLYNTRIGNEPGVGFNGLVDEIRLWNKPLSSSQIFADYNKCLAGNETGLILYYRANEQTGTVARDATSYNHTGTLTTTARWSLENAPVSGPGCGFTGPLLLTGNSPVCADDTLFLSSNINTPSTRYQWSGPNGFVSSLPSPFKSNFTAADRGFYRLYITDSVCYYYTDSIFISDTSVSAGTISPVADTICQGDEISLKVSGNSGAVQWQAAQPLGIFSDISGATDSIYEGSPGETTRYRVYSSHLLCADTSPVVRVEVNPLPVPPFLSSDDSLICASDSTRVQALGLYSFYLWNNGDTRPFTYARFAGGYWLTVTDVNGCSAVSEREQISVHPIPSISIIVNGDTLASFGAVSYQWYRDGSKINGATQPVYMATDPGYYTLEITDGNGCMATSTPVLITGMEEMENESVRIYPNPAVEGSQLTVRSSLVHAVMEVYDAKGGLVFNSKLETSNSTIDVNISKGVYFIRISSERMNYVRKWVRL